MFLVILLLGISIITITNANRVQASSANGSSDGKSDARQDFLDSAGIDKDTGCSPYEHSDAYCTAYKLAYEIQWAYMTVQYDCSSGECR